MNKDLVILAYRIIDPSQRLAFVWLACTGLTIAWIIFGPSDVSELSMQLLDLKGWILVTFASLTLLSLIPTAIIAPYPELNPNENTSPAKNE